MTSPSSLQSQAAQVFSLMIFPVIASYRRRLADHLGGIAAVKIFSDLPLRDFAKDFDSGTRRRMVSYACH
jgi:hypothetical protein